MRKLQLQLVSLALLLGLSTISATTGANHHRLDVRQVDTSQPATILGTEHPHTQTLVADGGDPVPEPIPLPRPKFTTLTSGNLLADGGDPVPEPIPLPRPHVV